MLTAQEMREKGPASLANKALRIIEESLENAKPEDTRIREYFVTLGKPDFIDRVVNNLKDRNFKVTTGANSFDETYVEVSW
jgi:hypothetical protein